MRWLAVVALLGCGDNLVDDSGEDRSGTQVRLRWYEYPDGARERAHGSHHDTRFDASCELVEWADGVQRCTPGVHGDFGSEPTYAVGVFTDAACTQLAGLSRGPTDFILLGERRDGRHYPTQLFRASGATILTDGFYERHGDDCVGPMSGFVLYEVGPLVPTAELVSFERRILPSTNRIAHRVLDGSDGTQLWLGHHDRELGVDCSIQNLACVPDSAPPDSVVLDELARVEIEIEHVLDRRLADRVMVAAKLRRTIGLFDTEMDTTCSVFASLLDRDPRCLPYPLVYGLDDAYAEPTCETPLRLVRLDLGLENLLGLGYAVDEQYFEIRAAIATAYTRTEAGGCVPFGVPPGYAIHALGPAIPRESFPAAMLVVDS